MPRKRLIKTADFPYHVFGRCNNKENFPIPLTMVWDICMRHFSQAYEKYGLVIHAFVLMNNHYHILVSTPEDHLGKVMNYWIREVSKSISKQSNRINHIFGGPYKWCLVNKDRYYNHVYRYVYRNPAEAGVCNDVSVYIHSTWRWIKSDTPKWFCDHSYVERSSAIPRDKNERRLWVNMPYGPLEKKVVTFGLRRSVFDFSRQAQFAATVKRMDGF